MGQGNERPRVAWPAPELIPIELVEPGQVDHVVELFATTRVLSRVLCPLVKPRLFGPKILNADNVLLYVDM